MNSLVYTDHLRLLKEYTEFWCGNLFGNGHLEDQEADGRITLRRVLRKYVGSGSGSCPRMSIVETLSLTITKLS
jgi:hypothetical protein